jgi:ferredoxin
LDIGLLPEQIHTETFSPSVLMQTYEVPVAEQPVEDSFANSNVEAHWQPGESLMEAAEKAGLQTVFECRSGSCGECACTLAEGNIT